MTLNDKGYLPLVNRKYTPSSKSGFTYSLFFFLLVAYLSPTFLAGAGTCCLVSHLSAGSVKGPKRQTNEIEDVKGGANPQTPSMAPNSI